MSRPGSSINLRDESGKETTIDFHEEPNALTAEEGYGYFPLTLEQFIHDEKLKIERKLGWGTNSTVWLARTYKSVTNFCDETCCQILTD